MAYTKTDWTSTKPINTSNLNNMDDGIKENDTNIKKLTDEVNNIKDKINDINNIKLDNLSFKTVTEFPETFEENVVYLKVGE